MNNTPHNAIDIIIPCWGTYVQYLSRAIKSAQGQGNILVTGDEMAADVALELGVRFVSAPTPYTLGSARQAGIDATDNKFMCFLDADDAFTENAVNETVIELINHPQVIAASGQLSTADGGYTWPASWRAKLACARFSGATLLLRNSFMTSQGCVIRRSAVQGMRLFPDLYDEDWHAAIALRRRGQIRHISRVTVIYDLHDESLGHGHKNLVKLRESYGQLLPTAMKNGHNLAISWRLLEPFAKIFRRRYEKRYIIDQN